MTRKNPELSTSSELPLMKPNFGTFLLICFSKAWSVGLWVCDSYTTHIHDIQEVHTEVSDSQLLWIWNWRDWWTKCLGNWSQAGGMGPYLWRFWVLSRGLGDISVAPGTGSQVIQQSLQMQNDGFILPLLPKVGSAVEMLSFMDKWPENMYSSVQTQHFYRPPCCESKMRHGFQSNLVSVEH